MCCRDIRPFSSNPIFEPGLSWLTALVPRQQPFSQRVENRLLKECKARSCADPAGRLLALSGGGFGFPNRLSSNLKLLLQLRQDRVELGIILEFVQHGIVEPEWQM